MGFVNRFDLRQGIEPCWDGTAIGIWRPAGAPMHADFIVGLNQE